MFTLSMDPLSTAAHRHPSGGLLSAYSKVCPRGKDLREGFFIGGSVRTCWQDGTRLRTGLVARLIRMKVSILIAHVALAMRKECTQVRRGRPK